MGEMSLVILRLRIGEKIHKKRMSFSLQKSSELGL